MSDLVARLAPRERRDLERHAKKAGVSVEELAAAFLSAYLLMSRDCPDLLPTKNIGKHGVSLGGGYGVS